jgi:uncharacterized alpha-E superfamily protein
MLSRVADALFWMSRYLERAEQVARLLDVAFHLELDLSGVLTGPPELHWTSLSAILQQPLPPAEGASGSPQSLISQWLTFDLTNPTSIMACVGRARDNARSIRGAISSEMWKTLNKLYWQLRDPDFGSQARESPHAFFEAVADGSHLFQGICDATLTHDEGWHFIQLGKYLERADKTLRILDVKYHLLQDLSNPSDLPLCNLQWGAVLRSCLAYESYQRRYVGRVEPEHVVEFLLVQESFPRSVRYCLGASARALADVEGAAPGEARSKAARTLGKVLSDLQYLELEQILREDFHAFLGGALERCAQASAAVQDQYMLQ